MGACFLLLWAATAAAQPPVPADEAVLVPMEAELKRSLKGLRQDSFGPPYYLAYRLIERRRWDASAAYGAPVQEGQDRFRTLFVEARYGGPALDNTELGTQGISGQAPIEPPALRQALWNMTDAAYKQAVAGYLEKKAKRATELVAEPLDDFSKEEPAAHARPGPPEPEGRAKALERAEGASAVFKRHPWVYNAIASVELDWSRRWLVTSEGTRLATPEEHVPGRFRVAAMTRAEDGMRLDAYKNWPIRTLDDLPPPAEIEAAAERLAAELKEAREAPVQEPASGPAVLDPEFTGVLFHEALGHKLEGQRQRDPQQSQLFKDRVGQPILPAFLSVEDDPTLASFKGEPLHGHYEYDSEGVRAQKAVLVERGVLKGFLMSRWPVKGFSRSNGHGRSSAGLRPSGRMSNLIVRAEEPVSRAELFRRLRELAKKAGKPYGFWLVGSSGGENPNSRASAQTLEVRPRLVYRVDAKTGKTTLVRGVSLVGTPLVVLNRLVAAGDDQALANGFVCGAESGYVPVAQIAPSVLASEIELQRLPEDRARPPVLPSPFHVRESAR